MSIKLVKGTPVVSLADGTKLGTIDRVYLDPGRKTIVGFSFHQGGGLFGSRSAGLIDAADVHAFGPDAVTVDDVAGVRSDVALASRDDLVDLEELLKRKVLTESGALVGEIRSIQFDQDSYRLTGIEVSPGVFQDSALIAADEIVNLGSELVVVADSVCGVPVDDPVVSVA